MLIEGGRQKALLALLAIALPSVGVTACSGAGKKGTGATSQASSAATGTSSGATTTGSHFNDAEDGDERTPTDNNDDSLVLEYGHVANAADRLAVTAFVKRYYAAAAAADGATVCPMLVPYIVEIVPYDYAPAAGPPSLRGKPCAVVMSKLLERHHRRLVVDLAGLEVTAVRVAGSKAFALLAFTTTPERRFISVVRERSTWKMEEVIDGSFP
jgi:hypothetical protein